MGHQVPSLSLIAALALMLVLACETREAEPTPAPAQPSPSTRVSEGPGRFVSADGRIGVAIPEGPGWECLEERHGEAEAAALALRCRRSTAGELFFFTAKTHRLPPDQRVDARTLLLSLYRADLEQLFVNVSTRWDAPAELAGASGWEVELDAEHDKAGRIRKRERVAIVGDRVFAVSAEGDLALWPSYAGAIEPWFVAAQFAR